MNNTAYSIKDYAINKIIYVEYEAANVKSQSLLDR
jgi:hypothetical protein